MTARTTRGSYPHPVLDDTDDIASVFEVLNFSVAPSVEDVHVQFEVRMTNPSLQKLIDDGDARLSFRWTCSATLASEELQANRKRTYADSTGYEAWIDQQEIRDEVRLEVKIVALSTIEGYRPDSMHPDYGDATFRLLPGDIIGDAGSVTFSPQKLYDPLDPPVGSCFRFVADNKLKRTIKVRFHDETHVLVAFPKDLKDGFAALANRPDLQISLVVVPALMQTIAFLKDNRDDEAEDLTNRAWFEPVLRLVDEAGGLDEPAFELAQKILDQPYNTTLLMPFENGDDDE